MCSQTAFKNMFPTAPGKLSVIVRHSRQHISMLNVHRELKLHHLLLDLRVTGHSHTRILPAAIDQDKTTRIHRLRLGYASEIVMNFTMTFTMNKMMLYSKKIKKHLKFFLFS